MKQIPNHDYLVKFEATIIHPNNYQNVKTLNLFRASNFVPIRSRLTPCFQDLFLAKQIINLFFLHSTCKAVVQGQHVAKRTVGRQS